MPRKARGSRVGKRLMRSAQAGAEDGASSGIYWIAFGAVAVGVAWLWNVLKRA